MRFFAGPRWDHELLLRVLANCRYGLVVLVQTPPQSAPTGISASATSDRHVLVTWSPHGGATSYEAHRRAPGGVFAMVGSSAAPPFLDAGAAPNTAYVRALARLQAVTFSADAVPGAVARAAHLAELRAALDPARTALSVAAPPYAESIAAGGLIKAAHVEELRSRLR